MQKHARGIAMKIKGHRDTVKAGTGLRRFCVLLIALSMLICTPAYSFAIGESGNAGEPQDTAIVTEDQEDTEEPASAEAAENDADAEEDDSQEMPAASLKTKTGGGDDQP